MTIFFLCIRALVFVPYRGEGKFQSLPWYYRDLTYLPKSRQVLWAFFYINSIRFFSY